MSIDFHDPFLYVGLAGAALMITSYLMTSMLPLRYIALGACVILVIYAAHGPYLPTLLLYLALLPINAMKANKVRKLVASIKAASADTPVSEWLLPHMTRRTEPAGKTLWHAGDKATEMLYLESGSLRLVEHDEVLGPGALVGEIGLFAPDKHRTLSLQCASDCVLYSLSDEAMAQLYYKNPKLGFHVMRLIVGRLLHDVQLAQARQRTQPAVSADA